MKPVIKPDHETIQEFGRTCVKHPAGIEVSSWHRVTVAVIASGQPRAYADTIYQADVLFEGGGNSTKSGIDNPFFCTPHESRVREFAYWLTGAKVEPSAYGTQLTQCECIEKAATYSIWRIGAVTPYCD